MSSMMSTSLRYPLACLTMFPLVLASSAYAKHICLYAFIVVLIVVVMRCVCTMVWNNEKEKLLQALYKKHKNTPVEQYVLNIEKSVHCLYGSRFNFGSVLKRSNAEQKAIYQRRVKINRYMYGMFDTFGENQSPYSPYPKAELYLVTLTYRDDVLAHTTFDSIKTYVRKFLAENTVDYMACVDFGKRNGRIHFHAVCAISSPSLTTATNRGKVFLQFASPWVSGYHNITRINHFKKQYKYAFKASSYAFKNANSEYSPFHKRGVQHMRLCYTDMDLFYFSKKLSHFPINNSSGFEVARRKLAYNTPMCWFVQSSAPLFSVPGTGGETETMVSLT